MALIREFLNAETRAAIEAAETLRDYCASRFCENCIFHYKYDDCLLMTDNPNNAEESAPAPYGWALDKCN